MLTPLRGSQNDLINMYCKYKVVSTMGSNNTRRLSSRKPRAQMLTTVLLLTLSLVLQGHFLSVQSMEIRKTIKEELLPGVVIVNLAQEPEFVKIVENASSSVMANQQPSSGSGLQYNVLTSGNPQSQFFTVDAESGIVSIKRSIDRERVCSFKEECHLTFEVAARSVYGVFFLLVDFLIIVTDINDNPPEFTQPKFEIFVPENSDISRSFQLPTAFDRDTGIGNGVSEYRILSGPPLFGLKTEEAGFNTSDVFLTLKSTITRESTAAYTVLIGAIDGGLPQLTGTLTAEIHISDINDNFPVFVKTLYIKKIPEDTGNDQVIEQVKATDADIGLNGQLRYSFSAQQPPDDLSYFRIDSITGEIYLARSIEARTGDDIELVVEASDSGHPPKVSRARVRIQVEDTVNSMPDIIIDTLGVAKGVAEVSEYAEIGKVVAYISVRDPDSGENGETSCKLSDPLFGLVKLLDDGKYKVVLETKLDREQADGYTVVVSCWDSGFPSLMAKAEFRLIVLDENDQKPVFSQRTYEATILENNTVGAFITQVTATDADTGKNAEIWFEVIGANKEYFNIDGTGNISAKVALDREYSDKIVATIVATDRGSPPQSSSATVVVTLLDVNDMRPEFSEKEYNLKVEEEQSVGRFVGIVSASDKDAGNNKNITYRFAAIHVQDSFNFLIGAINGVINTNAVLDREKGDSYKLIVLAIDAGVPPLTGTAAVFITILDMNDNDPYFIFPTPGNDTIIIPHTLQSHYTMVAVLAHDVDAGRNSEILYSSNTINATELFQINPTTGCIYLQRKLTSSEVGAYTLMLIASDQGSAQQRSTQTPLYIEVFFDNSTLYSAVSAAGPPKEMITALIVLGVFLFVALIIGITVICIRKRKTKSMQNGGVPNSASTSSTTKLQGGYYIAPGIRGSSSSFLAKQGEGTGTSNAAQEPGDGLRTTNPYVVFLQPRTEAEAASEIIEISRNGYQNGFNDTLNTLDLDQTDDDQFSTFRSNEDILSPGFIKGSLRNKTPDGSIAKRGNDTFDDTSCDDSTSDSGRGGSDVDVNAAAAKHDKARALAATPISVKSGISHRLSPLLQKEKTFATFRGESPSSFKFDSDSDTLTRNNHRSRASPKPLILSSPNKDTVRFEPGPISAFSGPAGQLSESDTDTEQLTSRTRPPLRPVNLLRNYSLNPSGSGFNSALQPPIRSPNRINPQPMFILPSTYSRRDSETDQSDGGSNPNNSLTRRNQISRLPLYPGIEFTHPVFGVQNRDSLSAFNTNTFTPNNEGFFQNRDQGDLQSYYSANSRPRISDLDYNSTKPEASSYGNSNNRQNSASIPAGVSSENMISDIQESRPVSMDEDFLLPPYPDIDEEDEESNLNTESGNQGDASKALISRTQSESSA